ncbi:hypothetical protein QCBJ_14550 [Pseudomonas sp. QC2]|nr:hypothetical protein QCBJ_14550 [Pseudomonas sp. QC2]
MEWLLVMSACILESRGVRGKGESVEGVFMKCVGAVSDDSIFPAMEVTCGSGGASLPPLMCVVCSRSQLCLNLSMARYRSP